MRIDGTSKEDSLRSSCHGRFFSPSTDGSKVFQAARSAKGATCIMIKASQGPIGFPSLHRVATNAGAIEEREAEQQHHAGV